MLLYLFAWCVPTAVHAQSAPRTLSYQGVLTMTGSPGTFATGPRLLTVTLYGDANGTVKLWQSTMNVPVDSNGVFNCTLGTADNPLPEPSVMDRALWLGVAVDNGPEMRPLSEVTASAYALNVVDNAITTPKLADGAVTTQKLADNSVTSGKIADSSITASKMATNYVGAISVNGTRITGVGSQINIQSRGDLPVQFDSTNSTIWLGNPPASFIGSQSSATVTNTDNGTFSATTDASSANAVVGGEHNEAWNHSIAVAPPDEAGHDFVGGGFANKAWMRSDAVVGGDTNVIRSDTSFIGGGYFNLIDSSQSYAFIGGGQRNTITNKIAGNSLNVGANWPVIAGGLDNAIITDIVPSLSDTEQGKVGASAIVGGQSDTLDAPWGFIGGGRNNMIAPELPLHNQNRGDWMRYDAIVGGLENSIDTFVQESFVGGGFGNHIAGYQANSDTVPASLSFIGGGDHNNILNASDAAIMGGDSNVISSGAYSNIDGGVHNIITPGATDDHSAIGGGAFNSILSNYSNIDGGRENSVNAGYDVIAGGDTNLIHYNADHAVIGGGQQNLIDSFSEFSIIAGGLKNWIKPSSLRNVISGGFSNLIDTNTSYSFIGGGESNALRVTITGSTFAAPNYSVLGGGRVNLVTDSLSVLVGGDSNTVEAPWAFLGGGAHNISGDAGQRGLEDSFVTEVGGDSNWAREEYSAIVGGKQNQAMGTYGFIGGGYLNLIDDEDVFLTQFSTIGGGSHNTDRATYNAITGGDSNLIQTGANYGFIGGGLQNVIDTNSPWCAIAGGTLNHIDADYSSSIIVGGAVNTISDAKSQAGAFNFIGAGDSNIIDGNGEHGGDDPAIASAIVAGIDDTVDEGTSFIGAGRGNHIEDDGCFIGSGDLNVITVGSANAIVAGVGNSNQAGSFNSGVGNSFIGAGDANVITGTALAAAIPAGDHLTADAYAQTVLGFYNNSAGGFAQGQSSQWGIHNMGADNPELIIGNGSPGGHSNAFEVSYDGHSTVHDLNGSGGATPIVTSRPALYGARYQDNTTYAWADCRFSSIPVPSIGVASDFGVSSVTRVGMGQYQVTLNTSQSLTYGAVTATLEASGSDCHTISCSPIVAGSFTIWIHDPTNCPSLADDSFMFQVVGRH